jgi:hypothetical protein
MSGTTKQNEDLACIALGYLSLYPNATYENFYKFIQAPGQDWNKVKNVCQLEVTTSGEFQKRFKNEEEWIKGSYMTALAIRQRLNLDLSKYIFCGVGSNTKGVRKHGVNGNIGEILKTKAASAIAKLYKFRTGKSSGIIANLNPDKLNISDIFLCPRDNHPVLTKFLDLIQKADAVKTELKSVKNALDELTNERDILKYKGTVVSKSYLTIAKYTRVMNSLYQSKDVIGVSLKKISPIPDSVSGVPFSFHSSGNIPDETSDDEFLKFVGYLLKLIKMGPNQVKSVGFPEFEKAIDEFITLDDDIKFTTNDRLEVKYTFNYKGNKKSYKIFTNFGAGNNFYFQPDNAGGYHEGGTTITRFEDLSDEFPQLKTFFSNLSKKREYYFDKACKNNGLGGSSAVYKDKNIPNDLKFLNTNKTIFPSGKYEKVFSKLLGTIQGKIGGVIPTQNKKMGVVLSGSLMSKQKTKTTATQRYYTAQYETVEKVYLKVLEQFYEEYTKYLSKGTNMGKFASLKNTTLVEMTRLVLEASKAKDQKETDKIMKKAVGKIQKSYAILTNAEFGYIFAKHNMQIKKILKKKMILSLYALATGRGFIIFKGKRFKIDEIYAENLKTPKYVKVGN